MFDKKDIKRTEISFLPPLKMILSSFDMESPRLEKKDHMGLQKGTAEEKVLMLIEKLSRKDE